MPFPVSKELVERTEPKLGRKLPPGYVARMRQNNGGSVRAGGDSWELHPIFDDSDRARLKRTCNDIVRETASSRDWPDFPENALAIGANGGGNVLIFLVDPTANRFGDAVYWWDHETGEMHKAADDFDEL